ncbi:MAG: hypothetical protein PHT75_00970 [Bacilli bacterium]|nr:hypothetical protein [Bacilli bacterium]MDD4053261.1 hypothetical protein [Bacilli bacterium]
MKIFIICSKAFYDRIPDIKQKLEENHHMVFLPNCYDNPGMEAEMRNLGAEEHSKFKAKMFKQSEKLTKDMDAVLVLNFNKNGVDNYIGGATFLEMYDAFRMNKKIYLYNSIPKGMLEDEIIGFNPILINTDINQL